MVPLVAAGRLSQVVVMRVSMAARASAPVAAGMGRDSATCSVMPATMGEVEAVGEGLALTGAPEGRGVVEGVGELEEEGRLDMVAEG